jgi:hypothetical protein
MPGGIELPTCGMEKVVDFWGHRVMTKMGYDRFFGSQTSRRNKSIPVGTRQTSERVVNAF